MQTHNIVTACALMALSATCAFAQNPEPSFTILRDQTNIEASFGYMTSLNDKLSVDSLMGGMIGISYTFDRTQHTSQNLSFGIGVFQGSESDSYTVDMNWASRGVIDEDISQTIIPVVLGYRYNYHFNEKFSVWGGARVGLLISKSEHEYYRETRPTSPSYNTIGKYKFADTDIAPTVGLNIGAEYQITEGFSWMVGVNFDFAPGVERYLEYRKYAREDGFTSSVSSESIITSTIYTGFTYKF